jgi:DNA-binding SARP family transcriptional activator
MELTGRYELTLLGTFGCARAGRAVPVPASCQRLLAYLALTGPAGRAQAAGALWPDVPQARASSNLRTVLWRLRQHAPGIVPAAGQTLWLEETVTVDYWRFERWARTVLATGPDDRPDAAPPAGPGTAILLPGWDDEWLDEPRETIRMLNVQACELLGRRLLGAGHPAPAISCLLSVTQLDPLRESAVRLMVQAHLGQGNVTDALACYGRYRRYIWAELGIRPGRELTELIAPYARAPRVVA